MTDNKELIADLRSVDTADHRILGVCERAARALEERANCGDYSELVKALRGFDMVGSCPCDYSNLCENFECITDQAAAAIEAMQDEVDKTNKSADAYRAMYFAKHGDITIEKVRELDEKDYYFHSALIRLMYRRIEELEAQLPKRGKWIRIDKHTIQCPLCHRYLDLRGVNAGRGDANYCPSCGAKTEVQDVQSND